MTKIFAAFMVACAFALAGCGGGGGGDGVLEVPVAPAPLPVVVPDVTFTNVTTSPSKTSVMPGERDIEVAAFRMAWRNQSHYSISQLVFANKFTESLWATFKDFKLVDAAGNDVRNEVPYDVRRDDQSHEVIVDFYSYSWYPNDFGTVPKTYSLLASLDPLASVGTTFALELTAVQMHDAGKTVVADVKGGEFKVMTVANVGLPVIATVSPAFFSSVINAPVTNMPAYLLGNFKAYCPKENTHACTLMELRLNATGVSEPIISVDGMLYASSRDAYRNDFVLSSFWYSIAPGQSKTFVIYATLYQPDVWISVSDMTWTVGPQLTKVNPVVPTGPGSCGLLVSDNRSCKG